MIMEGIDLIYRINDSIERTAVSGKTNYLVAGFEMDDGRAITEGAKYKEAKEEDEDIDDELTMEEIEELKDEDFAEFDEFIDDEAEEDEQLLQQLTEGHIKPGEVK